MEGTKVPDSPKTFLKVLGSVNLKRFTLPNWSDVEVTQSTPDKRNDSGLAGAPEGFRVLKVKKPLDLNLSLTD